MIVDRNTHAPTAAGAVAGKSASPAQPSERTAWLREMEKQEMTAWLSHPATLPGGAAPLSQSLYARVTPAPLPVAPSAQQNKAVFAAAEDRDPQALPHTGEAQADPQNASENKDTAQAFETSRRDGDHVAQEEAAVDSMTEPATKLLPLAARMAPATADLVAAVLSALSPAPDAQSPGEQALASVQAPPSGNATGAVESKALAATLLRPLAMMTPGITQRLPQAALRSAPNTEGKQASELQRRPKVAAEAASMPEHAQAPLRIHTVRTGSGVKVWIGADLAAGLSGQQLLLAAIDIRRLLKDQGTPLASLVYNGASVFDAGDEDAAPSKLEKSHRMAAYDRAKSGIGPRNRT
jgi:hypothetical protein